jgi:hypothetical protein
MCVVGIGVGCVFAPMVTMAMQNVDPRMAGAASGVMNTIRQVGSAIGSAAVGAILQHQMAGSLAGEAARRAAELPPDYRGAFVDGFRNVKGAGLGPVTQQIPASAHIPKDVLAQLKHVALEVFGYRFVAAMRPAIALPALVVLAGAAACTAIRTRRTPAEAEVPVELSA